MSPTELLDVSLVSKAWLQLAAEESLWEAHCSRSWEGKLCIPDTAHLAKWRQKWLLAEADSHRTQLTTDELCSYSWTFRFRPAAGAFWMAMDPFYHSGQPMLRRFFTCGHLVSETANDPLWGPHESRWRFSKSSLGKRGHFLKINHWPCLSISRTADWGWEMSNEWVCYQLAGEASAVEEGDGDAMEASDSDAE